jgi:hypothetical protein
MPNAAGGDSRICMMCGNPATPYLVGMSKTDKVAVILRGDCDLWTCEECRERKRKTWVARAIHGFEELNSNGTALQFCTITCHSRLKDFAATHAVFPHAWSLLYARMKRKQPQIEYLMIMEQHKNGRLHAHMMTTFQGKTRWMKDNCAKSGFGHQVEMELINNGGKAAVYTAKYLGKSLDGHELPHKFRRVRCSQGFPALEQDVREDGKYDWLVCSTTASLWAATEECQREKRNMVDLRTGEFFDYMDACANWY